MRCRMRRLLLLVVAFASLAGIVGLSSGAGWGGGHSTTNSSGNDNGPAGAAGGSSLSPSEEAPVQRPPQQMATSAGVGQAAANTLDARQSEREDDAAASVLVSPLWQSSLRQAGRSAHYAAPTAADEAMATTAADTCGTKVLALAIAAKEPPPPHSSSQGSGTDTQAVFEVRPIDVDSSINSDTTDSHGDAGQPPSRSSEQHRHRLVLEVRAPAALAHRDLQLVGRGVLVPAEGSKHAASGEASAVVIGAAVERAGPGRWWLTFGPWSCIAGAIERRLLRADIVATWLGTKFLGQRWTLPDRNDNPSFEEMRRKCLALGLTGDCGRFGVVIMNLSTTTGGGAGSNSGDSGESVSFLRAPVKLECVPPEALPSCSAGAPHRRRTHDTVAIQALRSQHNTRAATTLSRPSSANHRTAHRNHTTSRTLPAISSAALYASGQWQAVTSSTGGDRAMVQRLDDPVGLNRLAMDQSGAIGGSAGSSTSSEATHTTAALRWVPHCQLANRSTGSSGVGGGSSGGDDAADEASGSGAVLRALGLPLPALPPLGGLTPEQAARCLYAIVFGADARVARYQRSVLPPVSLRIALFGDSMMVEQFHQLAALFAVPFDQIRNGKHRGLRWMEFAAVVPISGVRAGADRRGRALNNDGGLLPAQVTIRVRFSRGYTTRGGHSVIARVPIVVEQLLATDPDIIAGNFAALHWQQNMRPLGEWEEALRALGTETARRLLRFGDRPLIAAGDAGTVGRSSSSSSMVAADAERAERRFYFWGPTLIQMGRTQGLQPSRTDAFAAAAWRVLGSVSHPQQPLRPVFRFFDPYALSAPRRESSFDGQHWACYHRFGGVSMTISQLFLATLCTEAHDLALTLTE